jgi:hypothetical protein
LRWITEKELHTTHRIGVVEEEQYRMKNTLGGGVDGFTHAQLTKAYLPGLFADLKGAVRLEKRV